MNVVNRSKSNPLGFFAYYHTKSAPWSAQTSAATLEVVGEQLPKFCDLELTPGERLNAAQEIAMLLPEELAPLPYSPQRTIAGVFMQLVERPNYAFDQDCMSAMIRSGIALGIANGYDSQIPNAVVRGLGRYHSVPRVLGKMQIDEAVYAARLAKWAEAVERTQQMGAEADLLGTGQRFAVALQRWRNSRGV